MLAIILIVFLGQPAPAQTLQPVPALTGHVVDTSGTLTSTEAAALEAKLARLERDKGAQVVVLLVPTTAPEDIAAYANRVGNDWKIGRRQVGDGLILLLAVQDRRLRIEVAKTLEGAVPDIAAKHIIDEAITPALRRGDFAGGIDAGVEQLAARIRGETLPPVAASGATDGRTTPGTWLESAVFGAFDGLQMLVLAFIALPVVSSIGRAVLGRKLGAVLAGGALGFMAFVVTGSLVLAVIVGVIGLLVTLTGGGGGTGLPRARTGGRSPWGGVVLPPASGGGWGRGGGGDWGGGSGGGGFSSGGGGDFGGGGASGSW